MGTQIVCQPEHIRHGQNKAIAKLFGVLPDQVTRWDKGKIMLSEKVLIRASRCGLTKGQILDAYDRRREDYQAGTTSRSTRYTIELSAIVESLTN